MSPVAAARPAPSFAVPPHNNLYRPHRAARRNIQLATIVLVALMTRLRRINRSESSSFTDPSRSDRTLSLHCVTVGFLSRYYTRPSDKTSATTGRRELVVLYLNVHTHTHSAQPRRVKLIKGVGNTTEKGGHGLTHETVVQPSALNRYSHIIYTCCGGPLARTYDAYILLRTYVRRRCTQRVCVCVDTRAS